MRNFILPMALMGMFAILAISGVAQNANDADRVAIRKVIEDQQTAWNRHDLEAFMAG